MVHARSSVGLQIVHVIMVMLVITVKVTCATVKPAVVTVTASLIQMTVQAISVNVTMIMVILVVIAPVGLQVLCISICSVSRSSWSLF